jgi:predicted RNA-binding Zn-ribbon protein involved in translation (DUF1610 family)
MFKSLRVPERLFSIAAWAVSIVFAGFLIGFGSKVVGELPGVDQGVSADQFVDQAKMAPLRVRADSLRRALDAVSTDRSAADLEVTAKGNAYRTKKEAFDNWITTRTATTDPKQDPEVISRTEELDRLLSQSRSAESAIEVINSRQLAVTNAQSEVEAQQQALYADATAPYEAARFRQEMRVFGVRLAITLPLLLIAIWLVARKRKSEYWPLMRGFVLFALFAFFVELVPYLPSYGGYVRYAVGIVLTIIAGHYIIRAMRIYVAKRQVVEKQTETERRKSLGYEDALRKMGANMCPGCERAIVGGPNATTNFCVHCGMKLFENCGACSTRHNAFFQYCPTCGVTASKDREPAVAGTAPPAAAAAT